MASVLLGVVGLVCLALMAEAARATQFPVGWRVPDAGAEPYNAWAGRMCFRTGDQLLFLYPKETDSVLLVDQAAYNACNTTTYVAKFEGGCTLRPHPNADSSLPHAAAEPDAAGIPASFHAAAAISYRFTSCRYSASIAVFFTGYPGSSTLAAVFFTGYPPSSILAAVFFTGYPPSSTLAAVFFTGYPGSTTLAAAFFTGYPPSSSLPTVFFTGYPPSSNLPTVFFTGYPPSSSLTAVFFTGCTPSSSLTAVFFTGYPNNSRLTAFVYPWYTWKRAAATARHDQPTRC
ncbi:hypothetical protein ACQ4PT_062644 [Festuca glaucescens]